MMSSIELEKFFNIYLVHLAKDKLIFEEKSERFTCSIGTSTCENFYFIETSEHTTSEVYYFHKDEKYLNQNCL